MIAEAGLIALWLAAGLALLQLALGGIGLKAGRTDLLQAIRPVAVAQGGLVTLSFLLLIWLFLRSDMSVALVVKNSASVKPFLYKFAGTWGNHEGSMLLWVTVMGLAGAMIALFERNLKTATLVTTLAAQAFISLGFYAFLLISSNPFERMFPVPADGQGLNPLLQDPGLAFHPPTLYFGYVGLSVAFSFAVGAMITRDVGPAFARAMRPWVLGAWIFLTLGITAGSYWAYYELGWGGWWFWDPVENASLMPWLAATALLHSVTVLATRDGLRAWTVMLAVVAFSMSMIGTFLVRSGILTSVHAFAVDPERGSFILALLAIYIGGAMALFALRIGTVKEGSKFELVSREGALVANNLLLSAILGIVFIGTLYPLFVEAITDEKLSVGPPYFNLAAGPITLLLVAIMAAGPLLKWRRDNPKKLLNRLSIPILVTAAAVFLLVLLTTSMSVMSLLAMGLAAGIALASFAPLWKRNLRRTPMHVYGMVIAHFGIAVALVGMASESSFTEEKLVAAQPGTEIEINRWNLKFEAIEPLAGPNWTALEARISARYDGGETVEITPQNRMFASAQTQTSEAALLTRWNGQLYVVLGEGDSEGRWQIRTWWKPFVTLIWYGGILVALGGLLAVVGRLRRSRRQRLQREYAEVMV
ncbi:cytochrome c-type biogenesis protein CcmF [Parasphingorhabdus marina DSM 22363]|uniref:Cytochrome c-type biogenesis protein CcmF n=1 Tax=Parasphingorhabdus marina DSM 22363 TaxID=1123272 RepID=A0A1N6GD73_9SPHN|nr:heme lyase CcmF/NrfE family subunit [Parasphingorhabdus marina]SIO05480.1 cytochrome c-type biogenesis protein CcmF [Parasphingorhabdus marina DSM 22363]